MIFETTIPPFEPAKTFHALDRTTTVIGKYKNSIYSFRDETFLSLMSRKWTMRACRYMIRDWVTLMQEEKRDDDDEILSWQNV
jgi:hypothetical protein